MDWLDQGGSNAESYVIYTDLFTSLLLVAFLMIGYNGPAAGHEMKQSATSSQGVSMVFLYADTEGQLYRHGDRSQQVEDEELGRLVAGQDGKEGQVTLFCPPALQMGRYAMVEAKLKQAGARQVFYLQEGE